VSLSLLKNTLQINSRSGPEYGFYPSLPCTNAVHVDSVFRSGGAVRTLGCGTSATGAGSVGHLPSL
jgi:hypothetical protein